MENPIYRYRTEKGLSQAEFGARLGRSKASVCRWEKGLGPEISICPKIEEVTGGALKKEQLRPDVWIPVA